MRRKSAPTGRARTLCKTITQCVVVLLLVFLLRFCFGAFKLQTWEPAGSQKVSLHQSPGTEHLAGDHSELTGDTSTSPPSPNRSTLSPYDAARSYTLSQAPEIIVTSQFPEIAASLLLVDTAVVLIALVVLLSCIGLAIVAAVTLLTLHGQVRQAMGSVRKAAHWPLFFLTISMMLRVDLGLFLEHPFLSLSSISLGFAWRSLFILMLLSIAYIFRSLIIRVLVLPSTLPSAAKKLVLPDNMVSYHIRERKRMAESGWCQEQGVIPIGCDGAPLDVRSFRYVSSINSPECKFWLVFFLGNMGSIEGMAADLERVSEVLRVNVVVFHYRGTSTLSNDDECADETSCETGAIDTAGGKTNGKNKGNVSKRLRQAMFAEDLVEDGCAVIRHLERKYGIDPRIHLILWGQSIGGAVAARVRSKFPGGMLVSDRSFSRLAAVPLAPLLSWGWGPEGQACDAIDRDSENDTALDQTEVGTHQRGGPAKLTRFFLSAAEMILDYLLATIGWSMDTLSLWDILKKKGTSLIVVYTKNDEIIHYKYASLFQGLCRTRQTTTLSNEQRGEDVKSGAACSQQFTAHHRENKSRQVQMCLEAIPGRDGYPSSPNNKVKRDVSQLSPHNTPLADLDFVCFLKIISAVQDYMEEIVTDKKTQ